MPRIKVRKLFSLFCALVCLSGANLSAKTLNICVDDSNWIPFIYLEDGIHKGIHIENISKALKELSIGYKFHSVPWKRCLKGLQKGRYDAVATASYKPERAEYLWYPGDAAEQEVSNWRVSQVAYVITLPSQSKYVYNGDPKTIPQPVRVPRGYSIGDDLRGEEINVDSSALNDLQNIKRMVRSKTGSVITLASIIEGLDKTPKYKGLLKSDPTTLKSKSYYFAISKAGQSSQQEATNIWNSIAKIREEQPLQQAPSIDPNKINSPQTETKESKKTKLKALIQKLPNEL